MVEIIAHVLVPTNLGFLILKRTKKEHGEKMYMQNVGIFLVA